MSQVYAGRALARPRHQAFRAALCACAWYDLHDAERDHSASEEQSAPMSTRPFTNAWVVPLALLSSDAETSSLPRPEIPDHAVSASSPFSTMGRISARAS